MSLIDRCRQWLQSKGNWNYNAVEPPKDEEQRMESNPRQDDDASQGSPAPVAEDGGRGTDLSWGARAFSVCALTFKDVQQGVAKKISAKPWSGAHLHASVAGVVTLLLLLLLYQIGRFLSAPDAEILEAMEGSVTYVSGTAYNCSGLGLTADRATAVEGQYYHIFPSDPQLQQTCRSKFEQHCYRKNSRDEFAPPPKFLALLRRYEDYHEKCTKGHQLTALGKAGSVPPGCKYLVWRSLDGMGNQLLSLVCAFVYSLLTDRVMLIDRDSHIDKLLCNPFPFSSWVLPSTFPEGKLRSEATRVFTYLDDTLAILQRNYSCNTIPPAVLPSFIDAAPKSLHAYITCCDERRDHQFFCPTAQKLFSGVNWLYYMSHEFTIPGFYFVPEFRDKLHDWFPHHDAFMHASRYLLSPQNAVWERISQFYRAHMDGADKLVGIQARSWDNNYYRSISDQIARCAVEENLLPRIREGTKVSPEPGSANGEERHVDISVLVTSLRAEYRDNLALEYANHPNVGDLAVEVISASSEGYQKTGDKEHDAKAMMDIWLLSFMDDLVITPRSTFGSTASGLAGIVPLLFRNYGNNDGGEPACGRTNAEGPCFIVYPVDQPCDLDPARASIFNPEQKVPEVKFCIFNIGLGIVTA